MKEIKQNFLLDYEENLMKLHRIKDIKEKGKKFFESSFSNNDECMKNIFISNIYEYLYKYRKLNTIKFMN